PELTGVLLRSVLGRGSEVDQIFLEPERLEPALPRGLRREHHAMAAALEHLADPDAVVRRPVGALRHEQDRESVGHRADGYHPVRPGGWPGRCRSVDSANDGADDGRRGAGGAHPGWWGAFAPAATARRVVPAASGTDRVRCPPARGWRARDG